MKNLNGKKLLTLAAGGFKNRSFSNMIFPFRFLPPFFCAKRNKKKQNGGNTMTNKMGEAKRYFELGLTKARFKRYEAAIEDFDKALEINPTDYHALNCRGVAKGELKRHKEAIADYDKAIEINPTLCNALNNRGNSNAKLKRYKEAIEDFNKVLQIDPTFGLGSALRNLEKSKARLKRKKWQDYLKLHNLEKDFFAKILSENLDDPEKCNIDWFYRAIYALEANRDNGGEVWQSYELECTLSYNDICSAIRAYERHNHTNYDDLLRQGYDRDHARAIAENQL